MGFAKWSELCSNPRLYSDWKKPVTGCLPAAVQREWTALFPELISLEFLEALSFIKTWSLTNWEFTKQVSHKTLSVIPCVLKIIHTWSWSLQAPSFRVDYEVTTYRPACDIHHCPALGNRCMMWIDCLLSSSVANGCTVYINQLTKNWIIYWSKKASSLDPPINCSRKKHILT